MIPMLFFYNPTNFAHGSIGIRQMVEATPSGPVRFSCFSGEVLQIDDLINQKKIGNSDLDFGLSHISGLTPNLGSRFVIVTASCDKEFADQTQMILWDSHRLKSIAPRYIQTIGMKKGDRYIHIEAMSFSNGKDLVNADVRFGFTNGPFMPIDAPKPVAMVDNTTGKYLTVIYGKDLNDPRTETRLVAEDTCGHQFTATVNSEHPTEPLCSYERPSGSALGTVFLLGTLTEESQVGGFGFSKAQVKSLTLERRSLTWLTFNKLHLANGL